MPNIPQSLAFADLLGLAEALGRPPYQGQPSDTVALSVLEELGTTKTALLGRLADYRELDPDVKLDAEVGMQHSNGQD